MENASEQALATVFDGHAIVEVMGHRRLIVGHVREVEMFGARMLRIDTAAMPARRAERLVYKAVQATTQFYGGSAIFSVTPVTAEVAQKMAEQNQPSEWAPLGIAGSPTHDDADDGDTLDEREQFAMGAEP